MTASTTPAMHGHLTDVLAPLGFAGISFVSPGTIFQGVCAVCAVVTCRIAWNRYLWDREDREARKGRPKPQG